MSLTRPVCCEYGPKLMCCSRRRSRPSRGCTAAKYGVTPESVTIVAARRFGQRIIVLSDTMISDANARADNILPGRVKSIVLTKTLTISYAGLSSQALDTIRAIHRNPPGSVQSVIEILAARSRQFAGELDFLVCSHERSAALYKISDGEIFDGADFYWVGNPQAVSELSQLEVQEPRSETLPNYLPEEEIHFTNRFMKYLREGRCRGVGGVVVNCLCSEYGHCYQNYGSAFSLDTITIGQDDWNQRQEINKAGMYHFEYNVYSAHERGQAVVGLYLAQSNVGFIHDPLNRDDAEKIVDIAHTEFAKLVGLKVIT